MHGAHRVATMGIMTESLTHRLDRIAARYAQRKDTNEVRFAMESPSRGLSWAWSEEGAREQYFVASVTKLVTTAIAFQQIGEGAYRLDTPAHRLLPSGTLDGLHVTRGVDTSGDVTVEHLLAHTSGIADYFEQPGADGHVLGKQLVDPDGDRAWDPQSALDMVRGIAPAFAPGSRARAVYSDTNYQLLQLIIEGVDGAPYSQVAARRVLDPIGMTASYVFTPATASTYADIAAIRYKTRDLHIPGAMGSFGADGSLVSTTTDQLALLQSFMSGQLFPAALLKHATATWRRIFFPLTYGVGVMRFHLPPVMNPWRPLPEFIGHSGASGAVLFWCPQRDLRIAGTVNQLHHRSIAFQAMSALVRAVA